MLNREWWNDCLRRAVGQRVYVTLADGTRRHGTVLDRPGDIVTQAYWVELEEFGKQLVDLGMLTFVGEESVTGGWTYKPEESDGE